VQQHIGQGAVPIRALQRYVAEKARAQGWCSLRVPEAETGFRVAVIGAGPAGITCAMRLLEMGHRGTVFDALADYGGIPRYVIPDERLDSKMLEAELHAILAGDSQSRLERRFGTRLGQDLTLDDLFAEGFDAVFVGIGLPEAAPLPGAQRPASGVVDALTFLRQMNADPAATVPAQVAVLGGGNTALDAALTAKRQGARDVYLVYRRSYQEMPAWPAERDRALAEGVHFLILTQPVNYQTDESGRLVALKVVSTYLGEPDESGRRRPIALSDSSRAIPVDLIIEALGQRPPSNLPAMLPGVATGSNGLVQVDGDFQTSRPGVFAGGDIVNGGTTVVQAVYEGLRAAEGIAQLLAQIAAAHAKP